MYNWEILGTSYELIDLVGRGLPQWLLNNIMFAIFLQFDEIDAAVHEPKIISKG